ncbi:MAG: winged helix DNA-binding domain-containing protein [Minicystis sp.]
MSNLPDQRVRPTQPRKQAQERVPALRVHRQLLGAERAATPLEVVRRLGALQAQDYGSVLWSIGARLREGTEGDVERAFADGSIVRSWPIRGTLHVVPGEDLRWMLGITAARTLSSRASRREELGVSAAVLRRCEDQLAAALAGGRALTRDEVMALWEHAGISTAGQRGYHALATLALQGLICFGPRQGKQDTFVLLDEWVPRPRELAPDEALAELARRYFTSHGPAADTDFARWCGIPLGQARAARAAAGVAEGAAPAARSAPHVVLLPGFDEYVLGYTDRGDVLDAEHAPRIVPGNNGVFLPTLLVDGRVRGTWKAQHTQRRVRITLDPFVNIPARARNEAVRAAERYAAFVGREAEVTWAEA